MRKLFTAALTVGMLTLAAGPAAAAHGHFVHIDATGTCQYVGPGQTSIDDSDHGGHHRVHDNVHMGTPGTDGRGNTFDKQANVDNYDCVERGGPADARGATTPVGTGVVGHLPVAETCIGSLTDV